MEINLPRFAPEPSKKDRAPRPNRKHNGVNPSKSHREMERKQRRAGAGNRFRKNVCNIQPSIINGSPLPAIRRHLFRKGRERTGSGNKNFPLKQVKTREQITVDFFSQWFIVANLTNNNNNNKLSVRSRTGCYHYMPCCKFVG